jgi:dTDP-4-amino-4,6-dideoxygalactose transaminase
MSTEVKIPFNKPCVLGNEIERIGEALATNAISGDGKFTKACHALIERELGVSKALLTTSCTHALEMSALLLDLQAGDEVIVPSFTFVSTVNAFVLRGVTPVFADIRRDTLNLDESRLEELITPRTKVIIVVHYAGVACEMDAILEIAQRHGIAVIEDNAHGFFGKYHDRWLGTMGVFGTQSFHETKNFTSGEGGALLINDASYVERAEILREKGTNRSRFFRGEVDKYSWVDIGSSYLPSDMLAAFLLCQLEQREQIQSKRRSIWHTYDRELAAWSADSSVTRPHIPAHCDCAWHMYYLLMPSLELRTAFISHLRSLGIHAVFHYLPLHLSEMGLHYGGKAGECPVSEDASDRLVRLPFFYNLTEAEQMAVIEAVRSFSI